jgi:hypothetical protein
MKPRVFVSSVIKDFKEYREACRKGIEKAGGYPVLAEDFPSLSDSPRNACLDGVASCDILIIVIGKRGGWTAPSGKLAVEEEYEEAKRRKMPILAFLQDVEREDDALKFAGRISDYINGHFRLEFDNALDLQEGVENSVLPIIAQFGKEEADLNFFTEKLRNPYGRDDITMLRFVVSPERREEMIDQASLGSNEFKHNILRIGHDPCVGLFVYESSIKTEIGINEIAFLQDDKDQTKDIINLVRLEITTNGSIIIDLNVTRCEEDTSGLGFSDSMVVSERNINKKLQKAFLFSGNFFESKDRFKRYSRMLYNVALSGIGFRTLMHDLPKNKRSYQMDRQINEVVIAWDDARIIDRSELSYPEKEIEIVISLFRRRLAR